jgi:hypothetical protein
MTPERWQQVKQVLAVALELGPEERAAYLDRSYAADGALRADIEPLVASGQRLREEFLGKDDFAAATDVLQTSEMSWVGRRVGAYRMNARFSPASITPILRSFWMVAPLRRESLT